MVVYLFNFDHNMKLIKYSRIIGYKEIDNCKNYGKVQNY